MTDGQAIQIKLDYNGRSLIFGDVIARVSKTAGLAVHIDTDEANAAGLTGTVDGEALSVNSKPLFWKRVAVD